MLRGISTSRDGQIILLSGFIMMLGLLLVTILLNDVILMSNTAGSGLSPGKQNFKTLHEMTIREVRNAVIKANKTSASLFNSTFTSYFNGFVNSTTALHAAKGEAVEIRLDYLNRTGISADYLNITLTYSEGSIRMEEKIQVKVV